MGFTYSPELKAALCDLVLDGMDNGLSLRKSCIAAGVPLSTFLMWCDQDSALAVQYARTREDMIQAMFEDLITISDAPVGTTDNGSTDSGAVAKQRLQVDTRKWALSKLAPKKYGDKLDIDMSASVTTMTEEQRLDRIAVLQNKLFVQ